MFCLSDSLFLAELGQKAIDEFSASFNKLGGDRPWSKEQLVVLRERMSLRWRYNALL